MLIPTVLFQGIVRQRNVGSRPPTKQRKERVPLPCTIETLETVRKTSKQLANQHIRNRDNSVHIDISWYILMLLHLRLRSPCNVGFSPTSAGLYWQQRVLFGSVGAGICILHIVQISIIHVDECIYIYYIYYYYDGCYCYLCLLFLLLLFFLYIWLYVLYTRYSIMYLCLTCIGVLKFEMLTCLYIYSDIYICYTIKYATADNLCYIHRLYTYIPHVWICMQYNNIPNKAISCITS